MYDFEADDKKYTKKIEQYDRRIRIHKDAYKISENDNRLKDIIKRLSFERGEVVEARKRLRDNAVRANVFMKNRFEVIK